MFLVLGTLTYCKAVLVTKLASLLDSGFCCLTPGLADAAVLESDVDGGVEFLRHNDGSIECFCLFLFDCTQSAANCMLPLLPQAACIGSSLVPFLNRKSTSVDVCFAMSVPERNPDKLMMVSSCLS